MKGERCSGIGGTVPHPARTLILRQVQGPGSATPSSPRQTLKTIIGDDVARWVRRLFRLCHHKVDGKATRGSCRHIWRCNREATRRRTHHPCRHRCPTANPLNSLRAGCLRATADPPFPHPRRPCVIRHRCSHLPCRMRQRALRWWLFRQCFRWRVCSLARSWMRCARM